MRPRQLSAGIVVMRDGGRGPLLLLLRAYRNWDFPKGRVEEGEAPLDAAIRETAEETGITALFFEWGTAYFETGPYAGNKITRYYLARTDTKDVVLGVSPELGRPEHHEHRWMDVAEALQRTAPRLQPVVRWAAEQWLERRTDSLGRER
jgi:bis(5'-nucleosidyl)-tetraphosphatase